MIKYLFLGDAHGDIDFAERAMYLANAEGCQEILQCGDWGFVWPGSHNVDYLNTLLVRYKLKMRWIDGNHDDHTWLGHVAPTLVRRATRLASNLYYQSRGTVHKDKDGTRFLFLGGAPSIDKAFRKPGKSWWPQEIIDIDQFQHANSAPGPVDVLVTHDAAQFPPGFGPKGDPEFQALGAASMRMIAQLVAVHEPKLHVHGHWHSQYSRDEGGTHTVGLASNLQTLDKASMIWSAS